MSKEEFKINDLVEITVWPDEIKRDWIITGFASNGSEAILQNIFTKKQTCIFIPKLKHQKKEGV